MELLHFKKDIPFMSYGKLTTAISLLTFLLAIVFLVTRGLHFSVEFTGGTVMEIQYAQTADLNQVRGQLDGLKLGDITVQSLGTSRDVLIRLPNLKDRSSAQLSEQVLAQLKGQNTALELRKVEFVGPQVGEELVTSGLTALLLVCAGIMLYLAARFEWRFAVAPIPSRTEASISMVAPVAMAAMVEASAISTNCPRMSQRRSTTSPSGTSNNRPAA